MERFLTLIFGTVVHNDFIWVKFDAMLGTIELNFR